MNITEVMQTEGIRRTSTTQKSQKAKGQSFSDCLKTSASLEQIFQKAAKKYGISEELLKAVGKAESGFDASATSHCGAQGIMQLMPSTAEYLGVKNAYDPEQNIMGGAKYLSKLLKKYNGNTSLALAAYNAGSGNVAKYGGIPPFEETQNYVKKILGYLKEDVKIPEEKNQVATTSDTGAAILAEAGETNPLTDNSDLDEFRSQLDLEGVFSYADYGKLVRAYFQSLSMTPFMDDEQSEEVSKQVNQELQKLQQAQDGSESEALYSLEAGKYNQLMEQLIKGQSTGQKDL